MFSKRLLALLPLAGVLVLVPNVLRSGDTPAPPADRKIDNFTLTDPRTQKNVSLADFQNKRAVVVVFVGTECPINNSYLPRLAGYHQAYADKGVQFLGINS